MSLSASFTAYLSLCARHHIQNTQLSHPFTSPDAAILLAAPSAPTPTSFLHASANTSLTPRLTNAPSNTSKRPLAEAVFDSPSNVTFYAKRDRVPKLVIFSSRPKILNDLVFSILRFPYFREEISFAYLSVQDGFSTLSQSSMRSIYFQPLVVILHCI